VVPTWLEDKPKEKSSVLEKSKVETSRGQEETGVAPEG
jgi:hypothetical protein